MPVIILLIFVLLGCGQHSFDNVFDDFFGTSSSSDFSSSSEVSSSSLQSSNSQYLSSSSFPSSSSRLGSSSSLVQLINYEEEEAKLYDLIMQYRVENGLPEIPKSKSLTYVAQLHVRDLYENLASYDTKCNGHSWSDKGDWTACCYTYNPDNEQKRCMWNKAGELTSYVGSVYEISYGRGGIVYKDQMTAERALNGWQNSHDHNAVILNENPWKIMTWRAIGVGIYGAFAAVWFGEEPDDKDGIEYKFCISENYGFPVCKSFTENFTLIDCKSLSSDGFRPIENPPANCIYL